ncbi:unnamed protein product [Closterium sp. NIES-65]|nr:unnamed protein product [Closterium sp. NIES-65]
MFTRKNSRSSDISSHPSVLELTFRALPPRVLAAAACVSREWRAAATSEPLDLAAAACVCREWRAAATSEPLLTPFDPGPGSSSVCVPRVEGSSHQRAPLTFRVLPPRDLAAAACVCREWRAAATSEPLWHRHTIARWPALASPAVARRVQQLPASLSATSLALLWPVGSQTRAASTSSKASPLPFHLDDLTFFFDLSFHGSPVFSQAFKKRFLRPGRASPLPFHLDDLTFFFDLSFHGSPVFSQAFKYEGGRALVPFAHHTFSDPSAIFPSIEALDKDSFRRSLAVNWTVLRRTDGRGSCLVRACPDREKLIPASSSGSSIGTSSSSSNTTNLMGAAAAAAAAGVAAAAAAAGGAGAAANVEMTPVNVLARTGAMEVNLTALKDRLGGTVRVDIAGKEFLLVLSALQWE